MISREKAKKNICRIIDEESSRIIKIGEDILRMPEKGFQEFKTSAYVQECFGKEGIPFRSGLAVTGVRADLGGGSKGPRIALMGELDALSVPEHPFADVETGAAHACGHNAQLSGMLGAAIGLKRSGVLEHLAGSISFMAVPAEELNDMNYRLDLRKKRKISFMSGKQEFIKIGCFDDIDMAIMIHGSEGRGAGVSESYNGFLFKVSRFTGRAAHSAASPHLGVNALQAASLALSALNAQNETYLDEERARIHSIFEIPSAAVNVVPAGVVMETQVRASNVESILGASKKADRALKAGALALGAKVAIQTIPGYMPTIQNKGLIEIYRQNVIPFIPGQKFYFNPPKASSTDMGDVSQIMPAIHPYMGGWKGSPHGRNFEVTDKNLAYVVPAKVLALCAIDLLWDKAGQAMSILRETKPALTKKRYLEIQEKNFNRSLYDYSR